MESIGTPVLWIGFTVFVLGMLALDLGVFHREAHEVRVREALVWTAVWISLALLFNLGVYFWFGSERALEFLTGYVIEKALSVDNIFVFLVVFSVFSVPAELPAPRAVLGNLRRAGHARAVHRARRGAAAPVPLDRVPVRGVPRASPASSCCCSASGEAASGTQSNLPAVPPLGSFGDRLSRRTLHRRRGRQALRDAAPPGLVAIEATDIVFAVDSIPAIFAGHDAIPSSSTRRTSSPSSACGRSTSCSPA